MNQNQELLNKIRESLIPFMKDFDNGNRNNRLSKEVIAGFSGFLENLILELLKEKEV